MANGNDPYADEVTSAKRLLAEKAYDEQPWSEWAGDVVGNAVNTARSILPTALGGRGEVGITDIVRGAYEAGKEAVTFPGDVITGKQALFDEAGRPLEQAVGRSFNTAATMGGASSMVPVPDNSLRIFGGVRSKTADMNALTKAQIMEREGASPDDIWRDTGWGRGADNQWRYEIPDYKAVIRTYNFKNPVTGAGGTSYNQAVFSELLDHPEFFEAYPELRDIKVNETFSPDVRGYYMPRFERGTINPSISEPYIALNLKALPSDENKLSTLLHEAQHAVQQKEGFAPGSNPKNYPDQTPNPMVAVYDKAFLNDPDLKFISSVRDTPEYQEAIAASNKLYDEQIKPRWRKLIEDEDNGIDRTGEYKKLSDEADRLANEAFPILKKVDDAYKSLAKKGIPYKRPKEFLEPTEAYRATAGEVEARNVQERMNMVPIGLRELAPWKTQESYHPYEGQIIDWNDTSWRKGYSYGGEVDDDIDDALRIAKDVGGSTPVLMEDAKGNKYDAKGNVIPPQTPGPNTARMSDPTLERAGMMDVGEPENYETEVKPFIDAATAPMNYAVEDPAGYSGLPVSTGTLQTNGLSLLDTMKAATQIAASGQPIDEYGEGNWGQARERAVRRFVGAPEGGEQSPYRGPFTYNPSNTADYINTLVGFSPYGWAELAHDIPYEAVRTGDYTNAAYEGGLNALFSAPGIAALGLAGRAGINAIRKNPKLASAIAAAATGAGSYFLPNDAEADYPTNKALELTRDY